MVEAKAGAAARPRRSLTAAGRRLAKVQKREKAMNDVRITVIRKTEYPDLMARYENPIEHACELQEGQVFFSRGGGCPEGLCASAWGSMEAFVKELARGGGNFFDGWMKDPKSAMISCNDGFRPVSFLLEAAEKEENAAAEV